MYIADTDCQKTREETSVCLSLCLSVVFMFICVYIYIYVVNISMYRLSDIIFTHAQTTK